MSSSVHQNILPKPHPSDLPVYSFTAKQCLDAVKTIRGRDVDKLGFAVQLSSEGYVDAIAFATPDEIFHLSLADTYARQQARGTRLSPLLSGVDITLAAFSMARLALHVHRDLGHRVCGVDLSTALAPSTRAPWSPAEFVSKLVFNDADRFRILPLWYPSDEEVAKKRVCLRAWLAAVCANYIGEPAKVDTRTLKADQLACLGRIFRSVELLEMAKPLSTDNEFKALEKDDDTGGIYLANARFKTRVRASENTKVIMETASGQRVVGKAVHAEGRQTKIHVTQGNYRGGIERIRVEGREDLTCAETARDELLLRLLQGEISLDSRVFIDLFWFPPSDFTRQSRPEHAQPRSAAFSRLNESQREVAAAMISTTEPLVVAHGPPGTGKTTTIAAAVDWWHRQGESVYIVAQSNVGVKNIARSLVNKEFYDFKLLVSKEFYVEWHEDLYERVEDNLIRSDDLFRAGDTIETERMFRGCRIVLCTLSMLSNPAMDNSGVYRLIPVERLVVDEASQIDESQYMHLFHKFRALQKMCLFGDPKQLPPFGRDVAPDLQSVFEIKHLKPRAYFLNTQYRMPMELGTFISHHVYDKKLRSVHKIHDTSCIAFVDAAKGMEQGVGKSWMNQAEVHVVVSLVARYYRQKEFCVITPYDAQRAAIVKALEDAQLPSDRVFNVDSFQGHEAAFVIVSAVRTSRPGFLSLQERSNVMLTRCTTGMVVVASREFVSRTPAAAKTLLGRLAGHWAERTQGRAWVDWRHVSAGTADLPGVRAPGGPGPRAAPLALPGGSSRPGGSLARPAPLAAPGPPRPQPREFATEMQFLNDRFRAMSMTSSRSSSRSAGTKAPADAFPALGGGKAERASKANGNLKGRWRSGSEVVKYSW